MARRTHSRVVGALEYARSGSTASANSSASIDDVLEIEQVTPLRGYRLRLTLSTGEVIERNVSRLLRGPVFGPVKEMFETARPFMGGVAWKNGADISPDVLIWGDGSQKKRPRRLLGLAPPR